MFDKLSKILENINNAGGAFQVIAKLITIVITIVSPILVYLTSNIYIVIGIIVLLAAIDILFVVIISRKYQEIDKLNVELSKSAERLLSLQHDFNKSHSSNNSVNIDLNNQIERNKNTLNNYRIQNDLSTSLFIGNLIGFLEQTAIVRPTPKWFDVRNIAEIVESSQKGVDSLADLLSSLTGYKICACVKLLEPSDNKSRDIDASQVKVLTLVRSSNCDPKRHDGDKHGALVSRNTDFREAIAACAEGGDGYFFQPDLIAYSRKLSSKNLKYENTTSDWKDRYRATIVIPIPGRKSTYRHSKSKNKKKRSVIGFLCVDSMSTTAFLRFNKDVYISILAIYATEYARLCAANERNEN